MVGCLPATGMISAYPKYRQPIIVSLPMGNARATTSIASPIICSVLRNRSLGSLTRVRGLTRVLQVARVLKGVVRSLSIDYEVFLIILRRPKGGVPIFLFHGTLRDFRTQGELRTGLQTGAGVVLLVVYGELLAVPCVPMIAISSILVIQVVGTTSKT